MRQVYDGGFEFFVGGGVAAFDCDDDGKSELYLAGGANPALLYRNESPVGGALKFSRVSDPATDLTSVTGAYPLDVDSDGRTEPGRLRVGEDVLLRGLGGRRFERANERWAYDGGDDWTAAFSATWEEGQDLPTLAVGNYLGPAAADGSRACVPGALHRPAAGTPGSPRPSSSAPAECTLSVLFADWNGTGRHDLRMANDRHYTRDGGEQLWRVDPGRPRSSTPRPTAGCPCASGHGHRDV